MSPSDFIHWEKVRPSSHDIGRRRTLKLELANSPDAVSPQRVIKRIFLSYFFPFLDSRQWKYFDPRDIVSEKFVFKNWTKCGQTRFNREDGTMKDR